MVITIFCFLILIRAMPAIIITITKCFHYFSCCCCLILELRLGALSWWWGSHGQFTLLLKPWQEKAQSMTGLSCLMNHPKASVPFETDKKTQSKQLNTLGKNGLVKADGLLSRSMYSWMEWGLPKSEGIRSGSEKLTPPSSVKCVQFNSKRGPQNCPIIRKKWPRNF